MTDTFASKFDKKRLSIAIHITILVLVVVFIINLIDVTYSRYESTANMNVQASIAVFLVDQGTSTASIALEGLEPSNQVYTYVINVRNYKDSIRTNVDLDYHIKFETTTNLPITISVYRNEDYSANATNIITSTSSRMDDDVYYKIYDTSQDYRFHYTTNEQDYYTIAVYYPLSNQNHPEYQGKIELLSVIITAEQVV
jgi:hypothetical protein